MLVTNRQDYTADFVVLELQRRGVEYFRLNTEDIPALVSLNWSIDRLETSFFEYRGKRIILDDISSIWYRRPVPPVPSPEITDSDARSFVIAESRAAYTGIWRSLKCFWISHPDNLHAASFKILQLQIAKNLGFNVPPTLITTLPAEAHNFISTTEHGAIYKPISTGKIGNNREAGFIFTSVIDAEHMSKLDHVRHAPAQFQSLVKKKADIRVTVIGSNVFAVAIDSQSVPEAIIDWRRGDVSAMRHTIIRLPPALEKQCTMLVSTMGLNFGAIDLVLDPDDNYYFLEINPNGQWAWIEQFMGLPLTSTLVDLLIQKGQQHDF